MSGFSFLLEAQKLNNIKFNNVLYPDRKPMVLN